MFGPEFKQSPVLGDLCASDRKAGPQGRSQNGRSGFAHSTRTERMKARKRFEREALIVNGVSSVAHEGTERKSPTLQMRKLRLTEAQSLGLSPPLNGRA